MRILSFLSVSLVLVLCAACSYDKYNALVLEQNAQLMRAYGDAMAKQTTEGGRIAIAIMFATGAGRQALARPETVKDYLVPVATVLNPWLPIIFGGGWADENNGGNMSAGRDIYVNATRADETWAGGSVLEITGDGNTQYVCPTCDGGTGELSTSSTDSVDACYSHPPAGYNANGTPLYAPGCSCVSHYSGKC